MTATNEYVLGADLFLCKKCGKKYWATNDKDSCCNCTPPEDGLILGARAFQDMRRRHCGK